MPPRFGPLHEPPTRAFQLQGNTWSGPGLFASQSARFVLNAVVLEVFLFRIVIDVMLTILGVYILGSLLS
jgi:hypothetical protein